MTMANTNTATTETDLELSAIVRAGCFGSVDDALREAVRMLFAVNPQLRVESAVRRYLDQEITLARAAELAGVTQWRFRELLSQRGIRITLEARPAKELDVAVERIRRRRQ